MHWAYGQVSASMHRCCGLGLCSMLNFMVSISKMSDFSVCPLIFNAERE